jgi:SAM-dependent methyltransferase
MARLTMKQDAYGREVYDYYLGHRGIMEIVERDDHYIDISSGPKSYFAEYKDWPKFEKEAIRLARGRVLDIGCGAGRILLYLQSKGLDCVGIDNSPLAIKTCKGRGVKQATVRPITQIAPDLGIFDTIIMYGNNFGLFGSYRRARWLLRKMYRMTSKKARIIAESLDVYGTTMPEHLAYHKRNRQRGRMSGQLRLRVRYHKSKTPYFDYLIVSQDEMRDILKGTGWKAVRIFDTNRGPYIAIIEKE